MISKEFAEEIENAATHELHLKIERQRDLYTEEEIAYINEALARRNNEYNAFVNNYILGSEEDVD